MPVSVVFRGSLRECQLTSAEIIDTQPPQYMPTEIGTPTNAVTYGASGWIIANSGDDVCLFSSDYPHVEGGRNPIKRFEASMVAAGTNECQKQHFYCDNFVDLMGAGLAPELRAAA